MSKLVKLMFDSGAFSAWRRGKVIKVADYIRFLVTNQEHLWCYINLDVIPGRPGGRPTQSQVGEAAEASWANYRAMRKAGLNPMPVYHYGESRDWLKRMVDDGATYIGLGGVAMVTDKVRRPWLDQLFDFFCGLRGYPTHRLHGFGITSPALIHRYPWYSTDSITWVSCGARGDGLVPKWNDMLGCYDYLHKPMKVGFSKGGSSGLVNRGHLRGEHYDVLGFSTKAYVNAYLAREDFKVEKLMKSREARLKLNARFFLRCSREHKGEAYRGKGGLFAHRQSCQEGCDESPGKYRLVFSGADTGPDAEVLTQEGARHRLMSFFIFMDGSNPVHLPSYVKTGYVLSKANREGPQRVRIV